MVQESPVSYPHAGNCVASYILVASGVKFQTLHSSGDNSLHLLPIAA